MSLLFTSVSATSFNSFKCRISSLFHQNTTVLFFSWVGQNIYMKSTSYHQNTNARFCEEITNVLIIFINTFKEKLKKISNSTQTGNSQKGVESLLINSSIVLCTLSRNSQKGVERQGVYIASPKTVKETFGKLPKGSRKYLEAPLHPV